MTPQQREAAMRLADELQRFDGAERESLRDEAAALLRKLVEEPQAEPVALLWQVRRALARASAICDAVPNRQEGHLGALVNAQPDGAHGYREIQDAEAALVAYLTTPKASPAAPAQAPLTIQQINALPEAGGWWPYAMNDRIIRLIRAVERAHGIGEAP